MRIKTLALSFFALAGCVTEIDVGDEETSQAVTGGTPSLSMTDAFIPFVPGLFAYQVDRGIASDRQVFFNFGSTTLVVYPTHDILPHDDAPDMKKRVRLTLSDNDPLQNPSGDIVVHGMIYERAWGSPWGGVASSVAVSEEIHFASNGTRTTTTFFDEITTVETTGLGMNAELEVEWWDGHEQEMFVAVTVDGVADEVECETDMLVYFNGQSAVPQWNFDTSKCIAGMAPVGSQRGMYFPLVAGNWLEDPYYYFWNGNGDPDVSHGHVGTPTIWDVLDDAYFPGASLWIPETWVRSIVVELERQSDLEVLDNARVMMTIQTDPFGNPNLVARLATAQPGAIAQLSPRGLDRLQPTHASTMTYPIVPAGTQPRLSQSAIDEDAHASAEVEVDLDALPEEDFDYWTEPNPAPQPNEGEFAGYLAYEDILAAARTTKLSFDLAIRACSLTPNPALCEVPVRVAYCVQHEPDADDFRIRIDAVDTYFDPARPDDALVIGDVTGMDLAFGSNEILADFTMDDIQGWLEAKIDPSKIWIEWDTAALDPCTIKPAARPLSDFTTGAVDYQDWLTCRDLSFAAGSGSLADPVPFDLTPDGEWIHTTFAPGAPDVELSSIVVDVGPDICGDSWLSPTIEDTLNAWQADVESAIAIELITSPGQDEALDRLLSPFELGVERVDNPPGGTPPYDVHPLTTYDLSAVIDRTTSDLRGPGADATDGLYVPYITQSSPIDATPYGVFYCPMFGGQTCDGLLGYHAPMLEDGDDPDGDPFDVSINYTTAHINQALWAQARRTDRLGSPNAPARLALPPLAVPALALALGYNDVVAALAPHGTDFGVRFHHQGAPYTVITDTNPPRMVYVIPNIIVELVSIAGDGTETVIANVLVDVIDRDLQVSFGTGGVPELAASWGDVEIPSLTSTHLAGCHGNRQPFTTSCDLELRTVLGALWWPAIQDELLDLIEQAPGLHLFDAGQESGNPRHLKNVRTFLVNQGLVLVGDLCKPGTTDCD